MVIISKIHILINSEKVKIKLKSQINFAEGLENLLKEMKIK